MELLFIRHGEPEWVRDGLSVDDPPLTERGRHQAELLAEHLAGLEADDLLVSPLRRAQQTAAPLAEALGRAPVTVDWLAEIAAPNWDGTPAEVVERIFADSRGRPLADQWQGIPGGESFHDFHERIVGGLRGLLASLGAEQVSDHPALYRLRRPERRIVVVAHAGTNATSLGHLLGIEPVPWEWERFVSFHSSVSTLRPMEISGAHSFSLFRFADVSHLPVELQTRPRPAGRGRGAAGLTVWMVGQW